MTEYDLAEMLNKAFLKVASMEKSISGFRIADIYPLNSDRFDENDFAPSVAEERLNFLLKLFSIIKIQFPLKLSVI